MRNGVFEILALGDRFSSAYKSISTTIQTFGELTFREESAFKNAEEAIQFIRNSSFDLVLMPNPYGNERRRWIYQHLKNLEFPVLVFDRGALPGSWFFDSGFNADSRTYHPLQWDHHLSDEENQKVEHYIQDIKNAEPLEAQARAIGAEKLRENLGLTGKRVLFVPFQRPSDTTIKFFSGPIGGFDKFTKLVTHTQKALQKISDDWVVIAKKHPLETTRPLADVMFVDDSTHIHDLIEMSDTVLLVNSGVGVIASLFDKPVLHAGEAFYSHPGMNRQVKSVDDVLYWLQSGLSVDKAIRNRFIHHLYHTVYSFGQFETETVMQKDGSYRNITRKIYFDTVRLPEELKKKREYCL